LQNIGEGEAARDAINDEIARYEEDLAEEFPRMIAIFKPYLKLGNI
jgi:hypothetical protein